MIRQPAVAGRFYPNNSAELVATVQSYTNLSADRVRVIGAVIPHAGYMYSGHVAGAVYSRIQLPTRAIILCPNHTGLGPPLSIMKTGAWQTPLGRMTIDDELSTALMKADAYLTNDTAAHRSEHATEVQLPFIQHLVGPDARFVPITVGTPDWTRLEILGQALAQVVSDVDRNTIIIASSDMNHYESDQITRVKDRKAIDKMLNLDARGLYETVHRESISMCGYGPTTAMLVAARQLGATKAELVKYATSGDVSGDFDQVVGYAGIAVM